MSLNVESYVLSKKYTNDTAVALGAVKGAPCTIKSIEPIEGGNKVTFEWTGTDGTTQTSILEVMDGKNTTTDLSEYAKKDELHFHANKVDVLDKLSVGVNGHLLFDGQEIIGDVTKVYVDDAIKSVTTQFKTLPTASATYAGKTAQYIGATNASFTHNFFYECVQNGANYEWKNVKVQSSGAGGATIDDVNVSESTTYSSKKVTDTYYPKDEMDNLLGQKASTTTLMNHIANADVHVTSVDKAKWDNKSDFDGKYSSLTGTPTIPTIDVDKAYVDAELAKKADTTAIPTKVSVLQNDSNYQTADNVTATLATYATKAELPTNLSALTNDTNFITNAVDNLVNYYKKEEVYTQPEINALISNLTGKLTVEIVDQLPTEDISTSTMYLIAIEGQQGVYTQYMYIKNAWAVLGTTAVDLSAYYTITQVDSKLALKADKTEIPTVPTTVSSFTNDAGYLTQHQDLTDYAKKTEVPTVTNDLTDELKAKYDDAALKAHDHANKAVIDSIDADKVILWNEAGADKHTHANTDTLNAVTDDKLTSWDNAANKAHEHDNKVALDTITVDNLAKYDDAATKAHTHANKTVIDKFTEADDGTLLYDGEGVQGVKIDDAAITDLTTWSSQKISENVAATYYSISDLNTRKGLSITLEEGIDNTGKIIEALDAGEQFVDWFSNLAGKERFGIDASVYGTRIDKLLVTKTTESAFVVAYMTSGAVFNRFFTNNMLSPWSSVGHILTDGRTDDGTISLSGTETEANGMYGNGATLDKIGFSADVMSWDTGVYKLSHFTDLLNTPNNLQAGRLEHFNLKRWGSNHNPYSQTYAERMSIWYANDGSIYTRFMASGGTAGVIVTDTGWRKITQNTKGLVTNSQTFKIKIKKRNKQWYGMFNMDFMNGRFWCTIDFTITGTGLAAKISKEQSVSTLIDSITYTTDANNNMEIGVKFTTKMYGTQTITCPSEFATIESFTNEAFTGENEVDMLPNINPAGFTAAESVIGYFVGGRALYRKGYSASSKPATATVKLETMGNNIQITNMYGTINLDGKTIPLPYTSGGSFYKLEYDIATKELSLISNEGTETGYNVIIEYYKL